MRENIDVSIIIVSYNCLDILENCLLSLFKHTEAVSFEVILVDNNTTIGSIESVTEKFKDIILVKNNENRGFAAANNQGFALARGKYILCLNNDTVFIENTIKKVYDFSESLSEPAFVGCKLLNSDGSLQASIDCFPTIWNVFTENFFLYKLFSNSALFNKYHINFQYAAVPQEVEVVKGAFIFAPKSVIDKYHGFDENFFFYAEETDLCLRFKKDGGKVIFNPETSIIHLGGATTDKYPWFKYENQHIAITRFYQKHFEGIGFASVILIRYIGLLIRIPVYVFAGIVTFRKYLFIKAFYYLKQFCIYPKNVFKNRQLK